MPSARNQRRYEQVDPKLLLGFDVNPSSIPLERNLQYMTSHRDEAVKIDPATGIVSLAADGDEVLGLLEARYDDNSARVAVGGLTTFKCGSGVTFTANQRVVGAVNGGVKPASGSGGIGRVIRKLDATHVLVLL